MKPIEVVECAGGRCGPRTLTAEEAIERLQAKGLDVAVLVQAYDWTFDVHGGIAGLTAGDQGFEDTGIVVEDVKKFWDEHQAYEKEVPALKAKVAELEASLYADHEVSWADASRPGDAHECTCDFCSEYRQRTVTVVVPATDDPYADIVTAAKTLGIES